MSDLSTKYLGLSLNRLCWPLLRRSASRSITSSASKTKTLGQWCCPRCSKSNSSWIASASIPISTRGSDSFPESSNFFPDLQSYNLGPDGYLELIRQAKESVRIPIIASLNGVSKGGWLEYARLMEQAGADAIELNIYSIATDPAITGSEVEQEYIDLVRQLKRMHPHPLAVKLSPFFSAPANMGVRLDEAHVDGIVLFNRFLPARFRY